MDTDDSKTRMFKVGLKADVYNAVAVLHLPTHEEVLQKSQIIADKEPLKKENNVIIGKKPWNQVSFGLRQLIFLDMLFPMREYKLNRTKFLQYKVGK